MASLSAAGSIRESSSVSTTTTASVPSPSSIAAFWTDVWATVEANTAGWRSSPVSPPLDVQGAVTGDRQRVEVCEGPATREHPAGVGSEAELAGDGLGQPDFQFGERR